MKNSPCIFGLALVGVLPESAISAKLLSQRGRWRPSSSTQGLPQRQRLARDGTYTSGGGEYGFDPAPVNQPTTKYYQGDDGEHKLVVHGLGPYEGETKVVYPDKTSRTFPWVWTRNGSISQAYRNLEKFLGLAPAAPYTEIQQAIEDKGVGAIKEKLVSSNGDFNKSEVSPFKQFLERHPGKTPSQRVVINASQTNGCEQQSPSHDVSPDAPPGLVGPKNAKHRNGIPGVHEDNTFGPQTLREEGFVEGLSATLGNMSTANGQYGAHHAFFSTTTPTLDIMGGYWSSNLTKQQQDDVEKNFRVSDTRTQSFRWQGKNFLVYQTGAMNTAGYNFHDDAMPTKGLEFGVVFTQMLTAMTDACNNAPGQGIVILTTGLGEGVFGNHTNSSLYALTAAYGALPSQCREQIEEIVYSTYNDGKDDDSSEGYTRLVEFLGGHHLPSVFDTQSPSVVDTRWEYKDITNFWRIITPAGDDLTSPWHNAPFFGRMQAGFADCRREGDGDCANKWRTKDNKVRDIRPRPTEVQYQYQDNGGYWRDIPSNPDVSLANGTYTDASGNSHFGRMKPGYEDCNQEGSPACDGQWQYQNGNLRPIRPAQ